MKLIIKTGLGKRQLTQILNAIAGLKTEEKQMSDEFHTSLSTLEDDVKTLKVNSDLAKTALDDLVSKSASGTQVTTEDLKALAQLHSDISDASNSLVAKVAADDPGAAPAPAPTPVVDPTAGT